MISPSLTMTVPNGNPPSVTLVRAISMARCAKSIAVMPISADRLRTDRAAKSDVLQPRRASSFGRVRLPRPIVGTERHEGRQQRLLAPFGHLALDRGPAAPSKELDVHQEVV